MAQGIDKGLDRYVRHSKPDDTGHHGELRWAVLFQQGHGRCVLTGCVWEPLTNWANFERRPGIVKGHDEYGGYGGGMEHSSQ
jgi:hypothetical protein